MIFKKSVFGDIIFDEEYTRIKQTPDRISDDDDFDDGKIYKISNVIKIVWILSIVFLIMVFVMLKLN